jgi:aminodeoxyfutalosine deaminase
MTTLNGTARGTGHGDETGPKIELHVHLEGTVRAPTLLALARRNDVALPAATVEELEQLYRFRDFEHFIEVFTLAATVLRKADDFRQVMVGYATEAARHGAVYLEAIFSPGRAVALGASWDTIFSGYCEGAHQAEEEQGITVRLTPEIYRGQTVDEACEVARQAVRFRDQTVVGLGLGGREARHPP